MMRGAAGALAADRSARTAAQREFERPLVVEAGAGTGKTATLVARILAWCLGAGWDRAAVEEAQTLARQGKPGPPDAECIAATVLDGVVAITFTEAAAAEMAARVAEALALALDGGCPQGFDASAVQADPGEHQARARALLVALDHLTVCTIHAFCRRILASFPLEAGLHPMFAVDADGSALAAVVEEVVERGLREALVTTPDPHLLALVAAGWSLPDVAEATATFASRSVPEAALERDPFSPRAVVALRDGLAGAIAAFAEAGGERLRASRGTSKPAEVLDAIQAAAVALHGLDETSLDALDRLCKWFATTWKEGGLLSRLRKWSKLEFGANEARALGDVTEAVARAAGGVARHLGALCDLKPALLDHARRVVAPLLAAARRELRERGIESFDGLLRDARDLLVGHAEVAASVRRGIRQLLVDEFQDTDRLQCEILRALALEGPDSERPGLFLVGDPKQSIYGWRQADLGAYEAFVEDVLVRGGTKHTLAVNFRAVPAILAEVERSIEPVMQREPGVQPAFEPLLASDENATKSGFAQRRWAPVEFWVSWEEAEDGPTAATRSADATRIEAGALAEDLRALHDAAGVPWNDVGVLLRTTGDLDDYLMALRERGVPYLVERDRAYYRRREVIEVAALVRTILDPADHLALVTWLRSAAVGVPDAAWIPLWSRGFPALATALDHPQRERLARVTEVIEGAARALPADVPGLDRIAGWERNLIAAVWYLASLREVFASESAAMFVERLRRLTLLEASEAARTLGAFRVANLDRFFRTVLAAIEDGGGNPQAVLRALREATSERREAEEARPRDTAEDAVRVMTVHKAKGLDFAHVYLMQTHKTTSSRSGPITAVEQVGEGFEYSIRGVPTPGWFAVEERRRRVAEAERVRTLYVALTRARQRLVVSGNWHGKRDAGSHVELLYRRGEPGGPTAEQLQALREQASNGKAGWVDVFEARWVFPTLRLAEEVPAPRPREGPVLPTVEEVSRQAARLSVLQREAAARMARRWSSPASEEAHRLLRTELGEERGGGDDEERRAAAGGVGDGQVALAVGSAVHRALELLDLDGDLAVSLAREREALPGYLAGLASGVDHDEALAHARAVLDHLAASPLLGRLREIASAVVARELPVLLPPEDRPDAPVGFVAGAIDVVYRDPSGGELVIVDYKTDDVSGEAEIAARAAAYAPQGAAYRRALQEALGLTAAPRFELWFLRADRIVPMPEPS